MQFSRPSLTACCCSCVIPCSQLASGGAQRHAGMLRVVLPMTSATGMLTRNLHSSRLSMEMAEKSSDLKGDAEQTLPVSQVSSFTNERMVECSGGFGFFGILFRLRACGRVTPVYFHVLVSLCFPIPKFGCAFPGSTHFSAEKMRRGIICGFDHFSVVALLPHGRLLTVTGCFCLCTNRRKPA